MVVLRAAESRGTLARACAHFYSELGASGRAVGPRARAFGLPLNACASRSVFQATELGGSQLHVSPTPNLSSCLRARPSRFALTDAEGTARRLDRNICSMHLLSSAGPRRGLDQRLALQCLHHETIDEAMRASGPWGVRLASEPGSSVCSIGGAEDDEDARDAAMLANFLCARA